MCTRLARGAVTTLQRAVRGARCSYSSLKDETKEAESLLWTRGEGRRYRTAFLEKPPAQSEADLRRGCDGSDALTDPGLVGVMVDAADVGVRETHLVITLEPTTADSGTEADSMLDDVYSPGRPHYRQHDDSRDE